MKGKPPVERRALPSSNKRAPHKAAMAGQGVCVSSKLIPERSAMTNRDPIPSDAVLVAIDIAKVRNEVLIEASHHKRRLRLSVLNMRCEHDRLIEVLRAYGKPVICAFKATGNYHRPVAWRLIEAGFDVRLVSSVALARAREALYNGWDKNDPRDAQVILHMLRIGQPNATMTQSGLGCCPRRMKPLPKRRPRFNTGS
jgi:hypothetical protein